MRRNAARDALAVTAGRIAFVALWFLAVLLVYRGLGADAAGFAQAGLFTVAIACVKIASGCIVDPADVALMRRVPSLLLSDPAAAFRLLRSAFAIRLGATLVVAAAMLAFAAGLGQGVVGGADLAPLMGFVAAATLGDMLFRSVLVVLQAEERFIHLMLLEGLLQILRLGSILLLWATDAMSVAHVLACYAGVAYVAAAVGAVALMPRGLLASLDTGRAEFLELLGFLKWMAPAMVLAAFNERLDILLVYTVSGAEDAGRYGAMLTLALAPDLVAGSLASIAQPRIARMRVEGTYPDVLRRFLRVSLPCAALAWLIAYAFTPAVIPWVLGTGYASGVPIFLWVGAGTLFWLAVTPLPLTMVAVHAPARIALVTLGQSAVIVLGGVILMPRFGAVGMAMTVCMMRVTTALALLVLAHRMAGHPRRAAAPLQEGRCAKSGL